MVGLVNRTSFGAAGVVAPVTVVPGIAVRREKLAPPSAVASSVPSWSISTPALEEANEIAWIGEGQLSSLGVNASRWKV